MSDTADLTGTADAPRNPARWLPYAAAALALCLAVIALIAMTTSRADATSPGAGSAEAGFARDMAVHHQQAVELSFIVRERTDDDEVRRLAYDIINTQANQRGMLLGQLETWGLPKSSQRPPMAWMDHDMDYEPRDGSLMPGMATNSDMDRLREAEGKDAEVLYLELMTAHHRGGVDMAQGAADLAEDPLTVRLAKGMVRGQQSEMKLMADMLAKRGANSSK
ncbi:DUF305 domain-containing protein [Streptomyces halobius]|uniref:DUF305 domain-containing protein n=1 Tax=Streptomyces halobius TaxID=2879846 RepID=A0ABY4M3W3_9ACTN|nr:DUF305 domain-containing protein [Streptomyces halobius]UQA91081.1 DUF305 domain-containing protein [Streptomyces halobius]